MKIIDAQMLSLIFEFDIVETQIKGMIWENEQRKILKQSMAYTEDSFTQKANELQKLLDKLKIITQNI